MNTMSVKKIKISVLLLNILTIFLFACTNSTIQKEDYGSTITIEKTGSSVSNEIFVEENGNYTSKNEVALYIYTYKKLPSNYITKSEASALGYDRNVNFLSDVAPGKSIGGDIFNNYEKILPVVEGRTYIECDIDYVAGKSRNAKRIVYGDDFDEEIGYIFYTEDHYNSFVKLY